MSNLDLSDVLRYAEEKTGGLTCPFCGNHDFAPAAGHGEKPIALLYEESGRSWFGPPGYLRVYALTCSNCSFIAIFKLEALEKWLKTAKKPETVPT